VRSFLEDLKHARKDEVLAVRDVVLSADPGITERIKWKAPSFCIDGDDRITFRLQPKEVARRRHSRPVVRKALRPGSSCTGIGWRSSQVSPVRWCPREDSNLRTPGLGNRCSMNA
jgi:hypothetical protein